LNVYRRPFGDQPGTRNGSKIERFHKTLRAELLTGHRFDTLHHAQQVLNAWVCGRRCAGVGLDLLAW
jgi:Integrase core domain